MQFLTNFTDFTQEEKPREKMMLRGPEILAPWELVAILLRTGVRTKSGNEDVMQLAKRLIREFGLKGLFHQKDVLEMKDSAGIYKSHSEILIAISEIFRRVKEAHNTFDASSAEKIFEKYKFLQKSKQEQCHVLHLNEKSECIFEELVAMGNGNSVQVTASDVLRSAIWMDRKRVAMVHNHPGASNPSKEDISWTLALAKGVQELHGISLIDHVIVGSNGYFSFQEEGVL